MKYFYFAKLQNLGDEWEGVSGVRDSKGNFHRWHDEIHLEPEGTEECGLISYGVVFDRYITVDFNKSRLLYLG